MTIKTLIVANILAFTGVALAAEPHLNQPKPKACAEYTIAKLDNGASMGVCAAAKPGGKPTYLRSFSIVKVTDPASGVAVNVMVGFQ